jgi:hypothetical protein
VGAYYMEEKSISDKNVNENTIAVLKKYNDNYYRIVLKKTLFSSVVRNTGNTKSKKGYADYKKFESSLSRSKSTIFEIALCNKWEYYVTMTLNPDIHNREDLQNYKKKLSKWLNNYMSAHDTAIKYLLIPELHRDGKSWHIHGFMCNIPSNVLTEYKITEKLPHKMLLALSKGRKIYHWHDYALSFGYITLEHIVNMEAVAKYVTKYITKSVDSSKVEYNKHLFYCSKGLKRAETIYKGELTKNLDSDFENDYIKIKNICCLEEALQYFVDNIE